MKAIRTQKVLFYSSLNQVTQKINFAKHEGTYNALSKTKLQLSYGKERRENVIFVGFVKFIAVAVRFTSFIFIIIAF